MEDLRYDRKTAVAVIYDLQVVFTVHFVVVAAAGGSGKRTSS